VQIKSEVPYFVYTAAVRAFLKRMNTIESTAVVELVYGKRFDEAHWRNLLTYYRQGDLQAIFDEYAHLIASGNCTGCRMSVRAIALVIFPLSRYLIPGLLHFLMAVL